MTAFTLVIAEHDNAGLKGSTSHTVTAAIACGGEVHVLVAGHNAKGAADAAAQLGGVAKVLLADAPDFADGLAENVAAQALAIVSASTYSHILAPATAYGKNILPRVAAALDVAQISEITKVDQPRYLRAADLCRQCHRDGAIGAMRSRSSRCAARVSMPLPQAAARRWKP